MHEGIAFVCRAVTVTTRGDDPAVDESMPSGAGKLTAEWPQAESDLPQWQAWNKAIEAAVQEMALQKPAANASPKTTPKWAAVQETDIDLTTAIHVATDSLVTTSIVNSWYSHGAAHPNTASTQFNWLLKERRTLRPEDVFSARSGWDHFLEERSDKYLHQQLDADIGRSYDTFSSPAEMAKTLHEIVIDPANWRIDDAGLTIVFQQYAVACYACTPSPVSIPWSELRPLLNQSFAVPTKP
jgi:hypothetical protein